MEYSTAEDFSKNVKYKMSNGQRYYTLTQVAEGLGIDWKIIKKAIAYRNLENMLGFKFVWRSFNQGRYFPEEAISKLYEFKDALFSVKD